MHENNGIENGKKERYNKVKQWLKNEKNKKKFSWKDNIKISDKNSNNKKNDNNEEDEEDDNNGGYNDSEGRNKPKDDIENEKKQNKEIEIINEEAKLELKKSNQEKQKVREFQERLNRIKRQMLITDNVRKNSKKRAKNMHRQNKMRNNFRNKMSKNKKKEELYNRITKARQKEKETNNKYDQSKKKTTNYVKNLLPNKKIDNRTSINSETYKIEREKLKFDVNNGTKSNIININKNEYLKSSGSSPEKKVIEAVYSKETDNNKQLMQDYNNIMMKRKIDNAKALTSMIYRTSKDATTAVIKKTTKNAKQITQMSKEKISKIAKYLHKKYTNRYKNNKKIAQEDQKYNVNVDIQNNGSLIKNKKINNKQASNFEEYKIDFGKLNEDYDNFNRQSYEDYNNYSKNENNNDKKISDYPQITKRSMEQEQTQDVEQHNM